MTGHRRFRVLHWVLYAYAVVSGTLALLIGGSGYGWIGVAIAVTSALALFGCFITEAAAAARQTGGSP